MIEPTLIAFTLLGLPLIGVLICAGCRDQRLMGTPLIARLVNDGRRAHRTQRRASQHVRSQRARSGHR